MNSDLALKGVTPLPEQERLDENSNHLEGQVIARSTPWQATGEIWEIPLSQVTPGLVSLFSLHVPTGIRSLAVLAGGNAGRIFTDDPTQPAWGLVWEADDGTLYRAGKIDRGILSQVVAHIRQTDLVALGFRDGDPDINLFPPGPDAGAECLEFDRPFGSSDLSLYVEQLPAGFELQRMDRALLEHSSKFSEGQNRYGSIENFLQHGLAVCIRHAGETVCEAYADIDVQGWREVGISTQPGYRRRGLATIACACLIQLCEQSGSRVYWDCVRLNQGSVGLARKLGFQNERSYKLLAWFPPKEGNK